MSLADNLRQGIKKKKEGFSSEGEVRDLINSAATKALKQFVQRMDAGEIPIDNISDFIRIIGAYKEINGISEAMEGTGSSGQLPELNMRTEKVINDTVNDGKLQRTEEDRIDIMNMSTDDMADLIRKMDIAQNKENEGSF